MSLYIYTPYEQNPHSTKFIVTDPSSFSFPIIVEFTEILLLNMRKLSQSFIFLLHLYMHKIGTKIGFWDYSMDKLVSDSEHLNLD